MNGNTFSSNSVHHLFNVFSLELISVSKRVEVGFTEDQSVPELVAIHGIEVLKPEEIPTYIKLILGKGMITFLHWRCAESRDGVET